MIARNMGPNEATKRRLESSFKVLQTILLYRSSTESAGLGWAIERAIVDRELKELDEDMRHSPVVLPSGNPGVPRDIPMDPLASPYLRPRLERGLDRLMNPCDPRDPDEDSRWPELQS